MPSLRARFAPLFAVALSSACGGELPTDDTTSTSTGATCDVAALGFEAGDPAGHADPFGAKAAGQARASRILASQVPQPAHGRH